MLWEGVGVRPSAEHTTILLGWTATVRPLSVCQRDVAKNLHRLVVLLLRSLLHLVLLLPNSGLHSHRIDISSGSYVLLLLHLLLLLMLVI